MLVFPLVRIWGSGMQELEARVALLTFIPNNMLKLFLLPVPVFLGLVDLEAQERNASERSASIREPSHSFEELKAQTTPWILWD